MMMNAQHRRRQLQLPQEVSVVREDEWRRFGQARRQELLDQDEMAGGIRFQINEHCRVHKYFEVADRVIAQFMSMYQDKDCSLDDTYVMGHRLTAFLAHALPEHPEYLNSAVNAQRNKSLQDLIRIKRIMSELALRIDEDQLNKYITDDFIPQPDDDDSSSSSARPDLVAESLTADFDFGHGFTKASDDEGWESFTGWAFDFSGDAPGGVDTDASSSSREHNSSESEPENEVSMDSSFLAPFTSLALERARPVEAAPVAPVVLREEHLQHVVEQEHVVTEVQVDILGVIHQPEICELVRYDLDNTQDPGSNFLHTIANEDVRYESDSEAVDSWAQDGDSEVLTASSGTTMTCDPARIAFREIMNRVPHSKMFLPREDDPPSPVYPASPPAPANTPSRDSLCSTASASETEVDQEEELASPRDHWASFDFATVRRRDMERSM